MAFNFNSIGHVFAAAAHDVHVGVEFLNKHQAQIDKGLQVGAIVVSAVDPQLAPLASVLERAGESVLGEALAVASKIDDASMEHGANVFLDVNALKALKSLLASIEQFKPGTIATAHALAGK